MYIIINTQPYRTAVFAYIHPGIQLHYVRNICVYKYTPY